MMPFKSHVPAKKTKQKKPSDPIKTHSASKHPIGAHFCLTLVQSDFSPHISLLLYRRQTGRRGKRGEEEEEVKRRVNR